MQFESQSSFGDLIRVGKGCANTPNASSEPGIYVKMDQCRVVFMMAFNLLFWFSQFCSTNCGIWVACWCKARPPIAPHSCWRSSKNRKGICQHSNLSLGQDYLPIWARVLYMFACNALVILASSVSQAVGFEWHIVVEANMTPIVLHSCWRLGHGWKGIC